MHRRNFIRNVSLTSALLTLNSKELFAFFDDPAYKVKMLTENLGIFTEQGGTIAFLLSKKGVVVVDSQFPAQAQHLVTDIKKRTDKDFNLLINTHHHADHTSGNPVFKDLVKHTVAHENCVLNQKKVAVDQGKLDQIWYADKTFTDIMRVNVNDEAITMHYFGPAHTNGDIAVHFVRNNVVHLGDLVFNRRYPYIDRPGGANIKSWINVLGKVLTTFNDNTTFIFGHALDPEKVTGTKDEVRMMQNYFTKLLEYVDGQIKAGKPKNEIVLSINSIPGAPEFKGEGIERSLMAAYDELTAQ